MKFEEAITSVIETVKQLDCEKDDVQITKETKLFGENALLDSMKLVELCLSLEDKAEDLNFEFNWTSDSAMSNTKSIFLSIETLSKEFLRQYQARK